MGKDLSVRAFVFTRPLSPRIRFAVIAAIVLEMLYVDVVAAAQLVRTQPWAIDFLPMWTAAHSVWTTHADPYDFALITKAQAWLLGPVSKVRPWVYPPSALLLLAPLGLIGFSFSAAIWVVGTTLANVWAALRSRIEWSAIALALVMPASMLVAVTGQVSFLIAGLSLLSLSLMGRRPVLAGVLIGLAGALKPSSLVLLPVALIAARAYRPLIAAGAAAAAIAACSLILGGPESWLGWLAALPRFQRLVMDDPSLVARMISPSSLLVMLGAQGWVVTSLNLVFALLAAALVWRVFRVSDDPVARLTALLGGGLMAAPYAMQYDAALLAIPAGVIVARSGTLLSLAAAIGGYLMLSASIVPGFGAVATAIFLAAASLQQLAAARALNAQAA